MISIQPMNTVISTILRQHKLRDTAPRRAVLNVISSANTPLTQTEISERLPAVNVVTIYRIIEAFTAIGLVHQSISTGGFICCSLLQTPGHHVLLHCTECGTVQECANEALCKKEDDVAASIGFTPKKHLSEVLGICSICH